MFEIRRVCRYRDPAYPSFADGPAGARPSFIADFAHPILPVAFAALTLTAVVDDDRVANPAYCSTLDARENKSSSTRAINRLSEESVATIVASLDVPFYREYRSTSGGFGTGSVSINFLTGAEVRGLCKSFFALNGMTLEGDSVIQSRNVRILVGDDQVVDSDHEREIMKTRGEVSYRLDSEAEQYKRLVRDENFRNMSKRTLTSRLLLEMERFLEWLDRNGTLTGQ